MPRVGDERRCPCGTWLLWAPVPMALNGIAVQDGRRKHVARIADVFGQWQEREQVGAEHACVTAAYLERLGTVETTTPALDFVPSVLRRQDAAGAQTIDVGRTQDVRQTLRTQSGTQRAHRAPAQADETSLTERLDL